MAIYNPPILHQGLLNSIFNANDFESTNENVLLTVASADKRYLKKAGGTEGPVIFSSGLSTPTVTLNGNTISQTSNQIGYYLSISSSTGIVNNNGFNGLGYLTLTEGVWLVRYAHILSSTGTFSVTQAIYGLTTSTSSYTSPQTTHSFYSSESITTGNTKNYAGEHIWIATTTTNLYACLYLTYSGSGMTLKPFMGAIRIA